MECHQLIMLSQQTEALKGSGLGEKVTPSEQCSWKAKDNVFFKNRYLCQGFYMSLLCKITFLPEHFSFSHSEEGFCRVLWSTVQPLMANKKQWTSHMLFLLLGHTFHPHPPTTPLTTGGLTPLDGSCFFSTGRCTHYMLLSQFHKRRTGRK